MAKKIKLSRKQMKQPDEFLSWTEQAWDWVAENIVYAAGILIGGVVVVLLVQWGIKSLASAPDPVKDELAKALAIEKKPIKSETDLLTDGFVSEDARNLAASEALAAFIKKYEGKPGADVALLYLGQVQEKMKNYTEAAATYNRLANSPLAQNNDYFLDSAYMGLARSYYGDGKYVEALENYKKVMAKDSEFKADAMIGAARCQFKLGQIEDSNQTLKSARADKPDSWSVEPVGFLPTYWANNKEEMEKAPETPAPETSINDGSTSASPNALSSSTTTDDSTEITPREPMPTPAPGGTAH